jgi:hypothetical protein
MTTENLLHVLGVVAGVLLGLALKRYRVRKVQVTLDMGDPSNRPPPKA